MKVQKIAHSIETIKLTSRKESSNVMSSRHIAIPTYEKVGLLLSDGGGSSASMGSESKSIGTGRLERLSSPSSSSSGSSIMTDMVGWCLSLII